MSKIYPCEDLPECYEEMSGRPISNAQQNVFCECFCVSTKDMEAEIRESQLCFNSAQALVDYFVVAKGCKTCLGGMLNWAKNYLNEESFSSAPLND